MLVNEYFKAKYFFSFLKGGRYGQITRTGHDSAGTVATEFCENAAKNRYKIVRFEAFYNQKSGSKIEKRRFKFDPATLTFFAVDLHSFFQFDEGLPFSGRIIQMRDRLGNSQKSMHVVVEGIWEKFFSYIKCGRTGTRDQR